jgi:EpsI family protein
MQWTMKVGVVIALLIATSIGVRATKIDEPVHLQASLSTFPHQLGKWQGTDATFSQQIVKALGVDDYLSRKYHDAQGQTVDLYVGYYATQRQGSTYHSPKNCLPGSGWTITEMETISMQLSEAQKQPVRINRVLIQRGLDRQVVLYWYQDRGRIITSEYWAKLYLVWDAIWKQRTDGAIVRIVIPSTGADSSRAFETGKQFVKTLFPVLQKYLPTAL